MSTRALYPGPVHANPGAQIEGFDAVGHCSFSVNPKPSLILSFKKMMKTSFAMLGVLGSASALAQQISESTFRNDALGIALPGGGLRFWWQLGAMERIRAEFGGPANVPLVGASAGALKRFFQLIAHVQGH